MEGCEGGDVAFIGAAAHAGHGGVQELVHHGFGEGFYGGDLLRCKRGELGAGAVEFGEAELFGVLLQGEDARDGVEGLQAGGEAVDFVSDDALGGGGFFSAGGEVAGGYLLEVVDGVDEGAFDAVDGGVDVARDGDVDEEDGAAAALAEDGLCFGDGEEVRARTGAGDDDVGLGGVLLQVGEGDGEAVELLGQLLGAGGCAVGDEDAGCACGDKVARGEFAHFACAYEQYLLAFE